MSAASSAAASKKRSLAQAGLSVENTPSKVAKTITPSKAKKAQAAQAAVEEEKKQVDPDEELKDVLEALATDR